MAPNRVDPLSALRDRLPESWARIWTALRAPRIRIEIYGGEVARKAYQAFNGPHPKAKFIRSKRWGVALLRLPDDFELYLTAHTTMRKRRSRALKAGFKYAVVSPKEYLDDIVEINLSLPDRQGRPMAGNYVEREFVARQANARNAMHGVVDNDGHLRAYAVTRSIGGASLVTQILGHGDDLDAGIMYLLISGVVHSAIETRRSIGSPDWLMYDTFSGATKGLAFFKGRAGFEPYTVDWVWVDRPEPDAGARQAHGESTT